MRFEFIVRKSGSTTPAGNEAVIAPLSAIRKTLSQLSSRHPAPSAEAEAQWEKMRKKLLSALEESKPSDSSPQSSRVQLGDGSSITLLFIGAGITTHELHGELRRQFESMFSSHARGEADASPLVTLRALPARQQEAILGAVAALAEMSTWEPAKFGKAGEKQERLLKKNSNPKAVEVSTTLAPATVRSCIADGQALGDANNAVRTLADLPANELNPASYERHAREFAKRHGLGYEFWDIAELKKKKAGAFLAVNRADPQSHAGIAILKYRPKKASKNTPVLALVGKGLCFDTGGYNVKTGSYMFGMHGDMTGSALAIALCGYFARVGAPFEVHAYLALAENLISPTAYKPNEVVVACDGTSIEVIDTDAEGRMVLSDTLALVRRTKPALCIDYATLTGSAIRALDTRRGAVFSNRENLAALAVTAGRRSGERTWSFPIGEDYREMLKSKVADLQQCASVNNADHIYAATFLSHFIGDETPWVHLDLVAAENKGGLGLASTDTTGFGVFWTRHFVQEALKLVSKKGAEK